MLSTSYPTNHKGRGLLTRPTSSRDYAAKQKACLLLIPDPASVNGRRLPAPCTHQRLNMWCPGDEVQVAVGQHTILDYILLWQPRDDGSTHKHHSQWSNGVGSPRLYCLKFLAISGHSQAKIPTTVFMLYLAYILLCKIEILLEVEILNFRSTIFCS